VVSTPITKIGPCQQAGFQYSDLSIEGQVFIFCLVGPAGSTQMTVHRPIGVTPLADDEWVVTPSSDIQSLLDRSNTDERKRAQGQREKHIREAVVAASLGRKLDAAGKQVWVTSGKDVAATIATFKKKASEEGYADNEWAYYLDPADKRDEERYKAGLKDQTFVSAAEVAVPLPAYDTKGGSLCDQPQRAVAYLKGKDLQQAKDAVIRRLVGLPEPGAAPEEKTYGSHLNTTPLR